MVCKVHTAICSGVEGENVYAEADISGGLPAFNIVGLAAATVKESQARVKTAMINSGFDYPRGRLIVNLYPANIYKNGSHLDLPIAISILAAEGIISEKVLEVHGIFGELSLDGTVMTVSGVLPMSIKMAESSIRKVIVPIANREEAMLVQGIEVIPVASLRDCVDYLKGKVSGVTLRKWSNELSLSDVKGAGIARLGSIGRSLGTGTSDFKMDAGLFFTDGNQIRTKIGDFADISGQEAAKRAACIAAAGGHGMIMIGPPGCGKSMIAKRMPTIMPEMSLKEVVETTMVYSVAGKFKERHGMITDRPFRMPYHTISSAGLLGGGLYPQPGEISLAHNGILFLDEICEYEKSTLEKLRIPIEEHEVLINRRGKTYRFPSKAIIFAASNPCPCGYYGDPDHSCKCTPNEIERYRKRLSGPILERIDIQLYMEKVNYKELSSEEPDSMNSSVMEEIVSRARRFAKERGQEIDNAELQNEDIWDACKLGCEESKFMQKAYEVYSLSPRATTKILKVARTIADIGESDKVLIEHISEAIKYRVISDSYVKAVK